MRSLTERHELMVEAYLGGMSSPQAAKLAGYKSHHACLDAVRRAGHPVRPNEDYRKYTLDRSFFRDVDTEAKAYWLGFIAADGCVTDRALHILLAAKDCDHLKKFLKCVGSNSPIVTRPYGEGSFAEGGLGSKVCIPCKSMVADLNACGIRRNKSFTLEPFTGCPNHLLQHYWRGAFDGDGAIYKSGKYKTGLPRWRLDFCGSRPMVEGFIGWVESRTGRRMGLKPYKNIFYALSSGTGMPACIARAMYEGATLYLDRKKVLVDELLTQWNG